MVAVISERQPFLIALAFWLALTIVSWVFVVPWAVRTFNSPETLVTNNRQDGPPRFTITNGPLVYKEAKAGGSPVVHPDWLARRNFHDYRKIDIYRDNALGPNVCTLDLNEQTDLNGERRTGPPFRNRAGSVQPPEGYSLDRWTNGRLARCDLEPGNYVLVTEYRVPMLANLLTMEMSFTSNVFTIEAPKP